VFAPTVPVGYRLGWIREEEVLPSTSCPRSERRRQGTPRTARLIVIQSGVVPAVNVDDDHVGLRAAGEPDVGFWPVAPPLMDDGWVFGGVTNTVASPRVLPRGGAVALAAGAPAIHDRVAREQLPAPAQVLTQICPCIHFATFPGSLGSSRHSPHRARLP